MSARTSTPHPFRARDVRPIADVELGEHVLRMNRLILSSLALCACTSEPAAPNNRSEPNLVAGPAVAEYVGTISVGPHGPDFLPDDTMREAEASQGALTGVVGYLVEVERPNPAFARAYANAIARGREMGIPVYGMGLRARLRGRVVTLSEERSGFTHGFQVEEVVSLRPCPKQPDALEGCSN